MILKQWKIITVDEGRRLCIGILETPTLATESEFRKHKFSDQSLVGE